MQTLTSIVKTPKTNLAQLTHEDQYKIQKIQEDFDQKIQGFDDHFLNIDDQVDQLCFYLRMKKIPLIPWLIAKISLIRSRDSKRIFMEMGP
ncbi:hypothetical protein HC864_03380 [Candidatus Gracilibacteria bacterium]|nr:hypothetical protein [Candidatus Gracilibacteria bacterium]